MESPFIPSRCKSRTFPYGWAGHTRAALRRTAKYGDCWHTTRQTPEFVAEHTPYLKQQTERAGRDPASVSVSLKRSLHFTDIGIPDGGSVRTNGAVVASTEEVLDDLYRCREIGIDQLTYDFRVKGLEDTVRVMDHLADRVLPAAGALG